VLCAKSYKIKKNLGLMPLRKKFAPAAAAAAAAANFFSEAAVLGVGRLAAATVGLHVYVS